MPHSICYVVYDNVTGEIQRGGNCADEDLQAQSGAASRMRAIEVEITCSDAYYTVDLITKKPKRKPTEENSDE